MEKYNSTSMKCKRPVHRDKLDQQLPRAAVGGNGEELLNMVSSWVGKFGNHDCGFTRF